MSGSRPRWAPLAAFALAGVMLGAVAAFAVRDRPSSDPGSAEASSPAVTVAPSLSALRTPAPTPKLEPTQEATGPLTSAPTPTKATSLAAFRRHVVGAIDEGDARLQSLRIAARAFDIPSVRSDSAALSAWAAEESSWLDRHPPKACYAEVHRTYASAIDAFGQASEITERFAKAFPFADYDELQRALDLANAGAASLGDAARLLQEVDC